VTMCWIRCYAGWERGAIVRIGTSMGSFYGRPEGAAPIRVNYINRI
jgi:hypothetical protein